MQFKHAMPRARRGGAAVPKRQPLNGFESETGAGSDIPYERIEPTNDNCCRGDVGRRAKPIDAQ